MSDIAFIVVIINYFGEGHGKVFGRVNTLTEARKIAYKATKTEHRTVTILEDSHVRGTKFEATLGLGEEIADVKGTFSDIVYYYPDYDSYYYNKKRNTKYFPKYPLNKDGTLGRGMW